MIAGDVLPDAAPCVGCADAGRASDGGIAAPIDAGTETDLDAEVGEPDAGPPIEPDAGPPLLDAGPPGPSSTRQTARPLGTTGAAIGFWEYLPPDYDAPALSPLLVFLHGIGENGDGSEEQLARVLRNGPPRIIDRDDWPAERPFVVLSAQHPGGGCPSADEVRDFLAFAMTEYDVDPARIYLTGLSCGAIGAWNYLGANLDSQIVALVAIAGDGRNAWGRAMCELGRVPIWAFHGDADSTVVPAGTIQPTTNLMACPAPPRDEVRVTIYPGVGHDSWTRTYDGSAGHDIYAWLLTKTR
jgi:dienelactone hydrolase